MNSNPKTVFYTDWRERETVAVSWHFTPSQPVQLYQGKRQTDRPTDRQRHREIDRHRERQRQSERENNPRQTDRQRQRHAHTYISLFQQPNVWPQPGVRWRQDGCLPIHQLVQGHGEGGEAEVLETPTTVTVKTVQNHTFKRLPNTAISLIALFHVFFFHGETFTEVTGCEAHTHTKKKKPTLTVKHRILSVPEAFHSSDYANPATRGKPQPAQP